MTSGGRRGAITDLLTTSRHPFRSFDTLRDSAVRRQVQSLILSSHRFLWPPLLLPPLTVPCKCVIYINTIHSGIFKTDYPDHYSIFCVTDLVIRTRNTKFINKRDFSFKISNLKKSS